MPRPALYQLHSLGAAGVPTRNPDVDASEPCGRGFGVLTGWLDHIASLGCGAVQLTPVFVSSTHGYDTVDPFRIDQRLGDEHDFTTFVDGCHRRGLKIMLDGVFNHVGRQFPAFRDVVARQQESPFCDWFRLDFDQDDGDGFGYRTFEGHRELVALNHRSEAVLDWAADVTNHWLDRGADGWRLDVAYAIAPAFLSALTDRIRAAHADAFVFGEMIHGDYGRFIRESQLDSVTQYELYKAIWSSLNDANLFELAWALKRHRAFIEDGRFAPVTFVGNHDVTRIASHLGNPAHLAQALAILFTVPGHPCVYYGDEFAWRGEKTEGAGGDDAVRPSLPPTAEPDGEEQAWALGLHRDLIAFRRDRPWLIDAELDVDEVANQRITYTVSGAARQFGARVTLDVSGAPLGGDISFPGVAISDI